MTDVLSMILLFQRTFDTLNKHIVDLGDDYLVEHDIFCSFVDDAFDINKKKEQWSQLTNAASELYQTVLNEERAFVTLGQARQTVDKLLNDIGAMQCGELTRIRNHLKGCEKLNISFPEEKKEENKDNTETFRYNKQDLQIVHIDKDEWMLFLGKIAKKFANNVCGTSLIESHNNRNKFDDNGINSRIIRLLIEETDFDIIDEDFDIQRYRLNVKQKKDMEHIDEAREEVFDTILNFYGERLTLQQILKFAKQFARFTKNYAHGNLKNIMMKYTAMRETPEDIKI
eukprot:414715_1